MLEQHTDAFGNIFSVDVEEAPSADRRAQGAGGFDGDGNPNVQIGTIVQVLPDGSGRDNQGRVWQTGFHRFRAGRYNIIADPATGGGGFMPRMMQLVALAHATQVVGAPQVGSQAWRVMYPHGTATYNPNGTPRGSGGVIARPWSSVPMPATYMPVQTPSGIAPVVQAAPTYPTVVFAQPRRRRRREYAPLPFALPQVPVAGIDPGMIQLLLQEAQAQGVQQAALQALLVQIQGGAGFSNAVQSSGLDLQSLLSGAGVTLNAAGLPVPAGYQGTDVGGDDIYADGGVDPTGGGLGDYHDPRSE